MIGVTGAFEVTLHTLADHVKDYAQWKKEEIQPTLIAPTPTYGLFLKAAKNLGYKVVTIPRKRNDNWRLDPREVSRTLKEVVRTKGLHATAFFDSNPHNPTGLVRGQQETMELAAIFKIFNQAVLAREQKPRGFFGAVPCLSIIDDMVYLGTEYAEKKPFSFSAIPEIYDYTFLMLGLSKIGLAGLRAGLLIVPDAQSMGYVTKVRDLGRQRNYFVPNVSLQALKFCFSDTAQHIRTRKKFLQGLAQDHAFSGNFMKALINGIKDVAVTQEEHERMIAILMKTRKCTRDKAVEYLVKGIAGVKVVTSPESGFFHLIDFSALLKSYYQSYTYNGLKEVKDEYDINSVFMNAGLKFCSGTFTGFVVEDMMGRVSYACPLTEIVEICRRLEKGSKLFVRKKEKKIGASLKARGLKLTS